MSNNCDMNYLCVWMDYYLCSLNKVIQGPTGPMGPQGPVGPQGPPGPAGTGGVAGAINGLTYSTSDNLVRLGGTLIEDTLINGIDPDNNSWAFNIVDASQIMLHTAQGNQFVVLNNLGAFYMSKPPEGNLSMRVLMFDESASAGTPNLKLANLGAATTLTLRLVVNTNISETVEPYYRATLFNVPYPSTAAQAFVGAANNTDSGQGNSADISQTVTAASGTNTYLWINYSLPPNTGGYFGQAVTVVVMVNGTVVWNTVLYTPGATGVLAAGIPPMPTTGLVEVFFVDNSFDTNGPDSTQGTLTVGGKYILDGQYTVQLIMNTATGPDSAMTSSPNPVWWPARGYKDSNMLINFKTEVYGAQCTDAILKIDKLQTYNNKQNVRVSFKASVDAILDFVDNVGPGASYTKSLAISRAQMDNNDFMVTIEPI